MYSPISDMPDQSRVWIYLSKRPFGAEEKRIMESKLREFCNGWSVHGHPVEASFDIRDDHFLILTVNEGDVSVSGCSIDSSVRVVGDLGMATDIDFFDRSEVAFLLEGKVTWIRLSDLRQKFKDGILNGSTLTFNTLASTLGEIRRAWQIAASESAVRRYVDTERTRSLAG